MTMAKAPVDGIVRGDVLFMPSMPTTHSGIFGAAALCITYVIAYACWYAALGLVRPIRLAALFNIEPLVTLTVAWIALGERMSPVQFLGAALVLASVVDMTVSRSTPATTEGAAAP